jgi:hypothetical protein
MGPGACLLFTVTVFSILLFSDPTVRFYGDPVPILPVTLTLT